MMDKYASALFTLAWMAATTTAQGNGTFAIRGRVVDAAAKPVAGAAVRLVAPGFNGFDVDEKTTTDARGRFNIAAPGSWTRMDAPQRQELGLVAVQADRIAVLQFNRNSAPPTSEVELMLANDSATTIAILSPALRPVVGAKVKIAALFADMIRVDLTAAEVQQFAGHVRKTSIGYAIATGVVSLPPDLQMAVGATDSQGLATVPHIAAARIGAIAVQADEFGEQTVGSSYSSSEGHAPSWPQRIVLQKTGRLVGQLSSPSGQAVAHREVTVVSSALDEPSGIYHASNAKAVTDREGKFEVPKMAAGSLRFIIKFDPGQPMRQEQTTRMPQLTPGEPLDLKIALQPAVRVEGRVFEAASRKPIRDVRVRAFVDSGLESATSDGDGKFVFWLPAGETVFYPEIPEEFLSAIRPSDYFDPAKRQKSMILFKVPAGKSFEAPPIFLQRAAAMRGMVVDNQGRPLPGSEISGISMILDRRTGQPKPREVVAKANERGEFTIAGLDPREPLRLRVTAKEVSKVVTIASPGAEVVRLVIAPNDRFRISGQVTDAEGKPVADAILEIWHRDWQPPPTEGEPKKLKFEEPIRSDAQGRFGTLPLTPDGHYRFTIRAPGAKTTESAWLDATSRDAAQPQHLIVTRLSGLAGTVRDRGGQPLAGAQVSLVSRETRTDTTTNRQGQFQLEIPGGRPFCVIVRHPDYRVGGSYYETKPAHLDQTLVRLTEPAEKLPRRPYPGQAERDKLLQRLLEPLKHKLTRSTSTDEKVMALQSLTGAVPDFVTEFLDKHPLQPAMYNDMLLTQVAMKGVWRSPEEAEEFIGRLNQPAQKAMAYSALADALPATARAKKLDVLAEALVGARAEKGPEFRAIALGLVAKRLWLLGDKDRAATLLREGEKIANGLSTSDFAGYARGCFATDLALVDLPAALGLIKDLKDRHEFARHHGNTAHRIAGLRPADAVKVLDLIPPPRQNEFNQRDQYAIRICYRMSQVDLPAALRLANSIADLPSRAYALGVVARGVAQNQPKQATDLLRRAFALVEEEAGRPDPPQLTSPLLPGSVAAALLLIAEQVDAILVRECLWRSVALARPPTENPQQVWRYTTGNNALAMAAARYDGRLAEFLLAPTPFYSGELPLARFLTDPRRAVESVEKTPDTKDDRERLQLIGYLAAEEDGVPRLIFHVLGMWRIDVEDIDF